MKKALALLAIVLIAACTTFVMAQPPAGGGNFDPAAMKERQLKMLKESDLKLTDAQADSVVTIQMEFRQQMRGMRDLSQEERQAKMKEHEAALEKRLTSALKDEALAKKVIAYQKEQMQKMRQGGGGGMRQGGGGGGNN